MAGVRLPDTQDGLAKVEGLSHVEAGAIIREVRGLREDVKDLASKFEAKLETFREDHTGHGDRLVKLEQIAERLDEVLGEQRAEIKDLMKKADAQSEKLQNLEIWRASATAKLGFITACAVVGVNLAIKFIFH